MRSQGDWRLAFPFCLPNSQFVEAGFQDLVDVRKDLPVDRLYEVRVWCIKQKEIRRIYFQGKGYAFYHLRCGEAFSGLDHCDIVAGGVYFFSQFCLR